MSVRLAAGSRLHSQVCSAEIIVVRGGTGVVELTCGGLPMVPLGEEPTRQVSLAPGLMTGTILGKRYTASQDETFELLVIKPGDGTLADGTDPLPVKSAKPLPASD